jgi:DNA polymerase/3'-5' exonuclease PolX
VSEGNSFRRSLAMRAAVVVADYLSPACEKIEVAGSLRRQCATVHDVDIVVWPKVEITGMVMDLFGNNNAGHVEAVQLRALLEAAGWYKSAAVYPKIIRLNPVGANDDPIHQVPVELYITEPYGENFAALLQMRTGSALFNRLLAERAKKLHLTYSAGYGIYKGADYRSQKMSDGTERGIFEALGMQYIEPAHRTGDWETFHRSCV